MSVKESEFYRRNFRKSRLHPVNGFEIIIVKYTGRLDLVFFPWIPKHHNNVKGLLLSAPEDSMEGQAFSTVAESRILFSIIPAS